MGNLLGCEKPEDIDECSKFTNADPFIPDSYNGDTSTEDDYKKKLDSCDCTPEQEGKFSQEKFELDLTEALNNKGIHHEPDLVRFLGRSTNLAFQLPQEAIDHYLKHKDAIVNLLKTQKDSALACAFSIPAPIEDQIPWPWLLDEKRLSFTFISLLLNDMAIYLRSFFVYLWNKKYPLNRWDDSGHEEFHREKLDQFMYGGDEHFTLNLANQVTNEVSIITLKENVLKCSQGFSDDGIYGCNARGGFIGCRILINGVFHWVKKKIDKHIILLETAPTIDPEGHYQVIGRNKNHAIWDRNLKSTMEKGALLRTKSIDEIELMTLFFMIKNSAHELLTTDELKNTLDLARNARHLYSGHAASTKLSYKIFYKAISVLLAFLRDIDKTFGIKIKEWSYEQSFQAALFNELFEPALRSDQSKQQLLEKAREWNELTDALRARLEELEPNYVRDPLPKDSDDYTRTNKGGSVLGKGSFGVTFKMKHSVDGVLYAVKRVDTISAEEQGLSAEDITREAKFLQMLDHPHIVRYFTSYFSGTDKQYFHVVMDLVEGESLASFIRSSDNSTSSSSSSPSPSNTPQDANAQGPRHELLLMWLGQITSALDYMHNEKAILHRDIKPENILIAQQSKKVVLIDLGLSCIYTNSVAFASKMGRVGSEPYMSYEKANYPNKYDGRDDIWSLGCVFAELLMGRRMNEIGNIGSIRSSETAHRRDELLLQCIELNGELAKYITRMLEPDMEDRISSATLHEWLSDPQSLTPGTRSPIPKGHSGAKKLQACIFHINNICKRGDACAFRHDDVTEVERENAQIGSIVCEYYKAGYCLFGERCFNLHADERIEISALSDESSSSTSYGAKGANSPHAAVSDQPHQDTSSSRSVINQKLQCQTTDTQNYPPLPPSSSISEFKNSPPKADTQKIIETKVKKKGPTNTGTAKEKSPTHTRNSRDVPVGLTPDRGRQTMIGNYAKAAKSSPKGISHQQRSSPDSKIQFVNNPGTPDYPALSSSSPPSSSSPSLSVTNNTRTRKYADVVSVKKTDSTPVIEFAVIVIRKQRKNNRKNLKRSEDTGTD